MITKVVAPAPGASRKTMPAVFAAVFAAVVMLLSSAGQTAAAEAPASAGFVAQAREAGLSGGQAAALQAEVDDYLVKLRGRGTQVSPNQIDMDGAVLHVTVPGEKHPRQLGHATRAEYRVTAGYCPYTYFCAYEKPWAEGSVVMMQSCVSRVIHWGSTGSWYNNQTPGTRPKLTFINEDKEPWIMPPAFSMQGDGVDWGPVLSIKPC